MKMYRLHQEVEPPNGPGEETGTPKTHGGIQVPKCKLHHPYSEYGPNILNDLKQQHVNITNQQKTKGSPKDDTKDSSNNKKKGE